MPRHKQEITIASFKVSTAMKQAITEEMDMEHREQAPMIKILLAEAISNRQSKRTMQNLL